MSMTTVLLILGVIAMVIILVSLVVSSADRRRECEEKKRDEKEKETADKARAEADAAKAKAEAAVAEARAKAEENEAKLIHAIATDSSTTKFEKGPFGGMIKVERVPAAVSTNQMKAVELCKETDLTVGDLRLKTGPGAVTLEAMAKVEAAKRGAPLATTTSGMAEADETTGLPTIVINNIINGDSIPFVQGLRR